jgi:hypothetical protein
MTSRIERQTTALRREASTRRRQGFALRADQHDAELALSYSNGYVTVEISHEALEAYIDMTGDVPLPVVVDPQTGERHIYDARNAVRVVHDAAARLREVSKRSSDGLFVRINFIDDDADAPPDA